MALLRLFRRGLDLTRATVRLAQEDDITRVSRLMRDGAHRLLMFPSGELPQLLRSGYGMLLECDKDLWGVAIVAHHVRDGAWMQGFALSDGADVRGSLHMLLPPLHTHMALRGVTRLFYAGDDTADTWLLPALPTVGYQHETEVVVYEKRGMLIPATGSEVVGIRPAQIADLAAITEVDAACFEAHWTKPDLILHHAISFGPLFIVATLYDRIVGYAYATSHFGGRLVHLVRIAVNPQCQGQAVGVRLLAEVMGFARRCGAQTVTLNTQAYNLRAQRLYRWFGFAPTGERQVVLRCDLRS